MKAINNILFIFIFVFIFSSCYKKDEGCTDINAMDYDVEADKQCDDDCCNYPDLDINMSLISDSTEIDTNTILTDDFGNNFIISFLRIYLSDFKLYDENGNQVPTQNDLTYYKITNDQTKATTINSSILKYNIEEDVDYSIGEVLERDICNSLTFNFGIDSIINHSNTDKLSTSSPLYIVSDSMHISISEGFYFLKMILKDTNSVQLKEINIFGDKNLTKITLDDTFDFTARENHTIKINIDQKSLFSNINTFSDNSESIIEKLLLNLPSSIHKD
ncbi:MAG: MbnP family protein [Saprospiraceae bacterium]